MALELIPNATTSAGQVSQLFRELQMLNRSIMHNVGKWLLVSALLCVGLAMAQSEPTLNQVYEAAQSGRMEQAQVMMQQVLVAHPGSAKAHFVQAELFARQGKLSQAREAFSMAEKLAPGLPFAKPEAVQTLRSQLTARSAAPSVNGSSQHRSDTVAARESSPASSFPWGLALALGGGAIGIAIFLSRRKTAPSYEVQQPVYANQGGLAGPQGFGMGNNMGAGGMPQPYGQPAGSGLGGRIMGGVATGLAVGAGVMAAEAIGRNLMGHRDQPERQSDSVANNDYQGSNSDMGGQNFGVNDAGSWDDGGSVDAGGGWDN
jgi:hypothetical protein